LFIRLRVGGKHNITGTNNEKNYGYSQTGCDPFLYLHLFLSLNFYIFLKEAMLSAPCPPDIGVARDSALQ
jgi:hypothetical protein